jgi:type 2 lantibiotic biosynthesis protein LanM
MSDVTYPGTAWSRAATLMERLASLRATGKPPTSVDAERAQRRLRRWRESPVLAKEELFRLRLDMDGLRQEELLTLLGEPDEAVAGRLGERPEWVADILQAYTRSVEGAPAQLPERMRDKPNASFFVAVEPLAVLGRERLRQGLERLVAEFPSGPLDVELALEALSPDLAPQLLRLVSRTLVLELNVARLEGRLAGESPAERFSSFIAQLREPERMLALLEEYPVLARQLALRVKNWVEVGLETCRRLCTDWEELRRTFHLQDTGRMVSLLGGAGDRHRGGRSVVLIAFESGQRLVYKPRSLSVDIHFQRLLTWLNERGASPAFRTLKLVDRGTYGWCEFIEPGPCHSEAELRRFYQRQGAFLALLYAIEATDFHYENVIAAGEHPMLIDLESLLHPYVQRVENPTSMSAAALIDEKFYSVLRVGLLPQRQWANAESAGIDMSGLGAQDGQLSPRGVPYLEGAGTDEMRVSRKRMPMGGGNNRPTLEGRTVDVMAYSGDISQGFSDLYTLMLRHREELLAEGGPLAGFQHDEVRVLLRPTMVYGIFLLEGFHPDLLRNALDRDRFFDRLLTHVERTPFLSLIVPAERDALHRGDIPLFYTHPDSRDLWSCGGHHLRDFFERSGMEVVRQRLKQLSPQDLEHQLWLVQASLATLAMDPDRPQLVPYQLKQEGPPATPERLLAAARAMGDRLALRALRNQAGGVSWFGLDRTREQRWSLQVVSPYLYSGLSGITLFLAYLGQVTGERSYRELAREAATTLWSQVEEEQANLRNIGAYEGWGGLIYTCLHLARLWEEPLWLDRAEWAAGKLAELVDKDEQYGLIGGAAGALVTLLELHRERPTPRVLETALRCGERLLAQAQRMPVGVGWRAPSDEKPLGGFSHGVTGVAWALLELAAVTKEERFREAAREAIAYERSLFSPQAGNWKDLRQAGSGEEPRDSFMNAWCHGAPGIGLGRLRTMRLLEDGELRQEVTTALETTLASGFGGNHSLCHGDLGNLELLHQAGRQLGDARWSEETSRLASRILASLDAQGPRCGLPLGVESPGLLNGLAGIGHQLLRLARPDEVPSVLTLEPPRASA